MQLHNTYTVIGAFGTVRAHNALASDFWQKAATHPHWAQFFMLSGEEGRYCVPATLSYVASDPATGDTLRAVYVAEANPPPARYTRVGLCYDERPESEMSAATLDITVAGEEVALSAEVYLTLSYENNVRFCGGDNPLVRQLLGCGNAGAPRIGWGNCDYPSLPFARTEYGLTFTETERTDGFGYRTAAPTYGYELVLYGDDAPLLRALRPLSYATLSCAEEVQDSSVVCDGLPESIYNMTVGSARPLILNTCRIPTAVLPVHRDCIRNMGVEGRVLSDPVGEYVAFVTASYVEVFRADPLAFTSCLRVPRDGEYAELCRGGALAMWSSANTLTIYEPDENGTYDSFTVSIPYGNARIVLRDGNSYHVAYRRSALFVRNSVTREGVTVVSQSRITASLFFMGRCGDAVMCCDSAVHVYTLDADLSAEYLCDELKTHRATRTMLGAGDCMAVVRESGNCLVYDLVHNKTLAPGEDLQANGRLAYNENGAYIYDYRNGLRKIEGAYDFGGITGACLAGNLLFAVCNGKLYCYYVFGTQTAVRIPAGHEGEVAFFNARNREWAGVGEGACFTVGAAS